MPVVVTKQRLVEVHDLGKGIHVNEELKKVEIMIDGVTVRFNDQGQLTAVAQVDVHVANAELVDETTLRISLSNGSNFDVPLAKFLNIDTDTKPTAAAMDGDNLVITLSDGTTVSGTLGDWLTSKHHTELETVGGVKIGFSVV